MALRFFLHAQVGPMYEADDPSLHPLGSMMTSDVMGVPALALDALEILELVRLGRSQYEGWVGNGWSADFTPEGLHLQDLHSDDWSADYSLVYAREVILDYLLFLRHSPEGRAQELARWEAANGCPHLARDDI